VAVATKADKIKPGKRAEHIRVVRQGLAMATDVPLFLFSSQNREGRHQLWGHLDSLLTPIVRRQGVSSSS
jgi:GTP-binding protein